MTSMSETVSTHQTRELVHRYYEIVAAGRTNELDEVCAPDLAGHAGAGKDLAALKGSIAGFVDAFADLVVDVRHVVVEDAVASTWVTYRGIHRAAFAGIEATGRHVEFAGWDLFRIQDRKIAEITSYCDLYTLMRQLSG